MKIGISKRKHVPVLKVDNVAYPLWKYRYVQRIERMLNELSLDETASYLVKYELDIYEKCYLQINLKGKTVLDVGACCGETAYMFLHHGAKKVICVEADTKRASMIQKNKEKLGLNIDVIGEFFDIRHLQIPHDFLKCDIEGGEIALLPLTDSLKPTVLEVHGQPLKSQFENKGFRVLHYDPHQQTWLVTNC